MFAHRLTYMHVKGESKTGMLLKTRYKSQILVWNKQGQKLEAVTHLQLHSKYFCESSSPKSSKELQRDRPICKNDSDMLIAFTLHKY